MGCLSSSPEIMPKRNPGGISITRSNHSDGENPEDAFPTLIQELTKFVYLDHMVQSISISRDAFPVIIPQRDYHINPTDICLPLISASCFSGNRVICLPSINLFDREIFAARFIKQFLGNVLYWTSEQNSTFSKAFIYGFSDQHKDLLITRFEDLGYSCETELSFVNQPLSNYHLLILPSTINSHNPDDANLINALEKTEVGIIFIYIPSQNPDIPFPCNTFLSHFGLSYVDSPWHIEKGQFMIERNFVSIMSYHYLSYTACLKRILSTSSSIPSLDKKSNDINGTELSTSAADNPTLNKLDFIVTALRTILSVVGEGCEFHVNIVASECYNYLESSHAFCEGFFCSSPEQSIILILLQEALIKLSPEHILALPGLDSFPGPIAPPSKLPPITTRINISLSSHAWSSTGLYLRPGVVATITLLSVRPELPDKIFSISEAGTGDSNPNTTDYTEGIHFQIGAHTESLLFRNPPWRRWPVLSTVYAACPLGVSTKIASPYGGILYVASTSEVGLDIEIECENFIRHPRNVIGNPEVWEETQSNEVPFGEIETQRLIITMPSNEMREMQNYFPDIANIFDRGIDIISSFMNNRPSYPFRIVFDIELPDSGPSCGYPIVFDLSSTKMLSKIGEPSPMLFALMNLFALLMLRENCFDDDVEVVLAEIAARKAFKTLFPDFKDDDIPISSEVKLFSSLNMIQESHPDVISNALKKFQNQDYQIEGMPEDIWLDFVKEMCRIGNKDFTKQLEIARPIPLNISSSLSHLILTDIDPDTNE